VAAAVAVIVVILFLFFFQFLSFIHYCYYWSIFSPALFCMPIIVVSRGGGGLLLSFSLSLVLFIVVL